MMSIAMAKTMVAMVETTGSAGHGADMAQAEPGGVAMAGAEVAAPMGPLARIWRKLWDRSVPALDVPLAEGRGAV